VDETSVAAARVLARALIPFTRALAGTDEALVEHVEKLGWTLPEVPQALRDLQAAGNRAAGSLATLEQALRQLTEASTAESDLEQPAADLLLDLAMLTAAIRELPAGLRSQLPPAYVAATHIDEDIQRRLYGDALSRQLEHASITVYLIAKALGMVESVPRDADPTRFQPAFEERTIRWDRLAAIPNGPAPLMRDVYGWGTPAFGAEALFRALRDVSVVVLSPAFFDYASPSLLRAIVTGLPDNALRTRGLLVPLFQGSPLELFLGLYRLPPQDPQDLPGILTVLTGLASVQQSFPVAPSVILKIDSQIDLAAGVGLAIRPGRPPKLLGDLATAGAQLIQAGSAKVSVVYGPLEEAGRLSLLDVGGLGVDSRGLSLDAGLSIGPDTGVDGLVEVTLTKLRVQLSGLGQDSFLATVLPDDVSVEFDLTVGWSSAKGLYWHGLTGPEVTIPVARRIGPIDLRQLVVSLDSSDGTFQLAVGVSASSELGPVLVEVEGVGAAVAVDTNGGNLGLLDLRPTLRPPTGVGLSIDLGPSVGGGFLSYDAQRGEYAGALELQLGKIGVKAVGVLSTGPGDWSLALLLYAQVPPIQLGFGFTLDAIGGLIGVQRGVDVQQLITGMTNGAFDDILFPPDPVGDAPRILGRLRTLFPVRPGSLTVGPMVDVHWGKPLMLTARLAILIQLDNALGSGGGPLAVARVVVVGQLHVDVGPTEEEPYARVVRLTVDVLGFWDLADKRYGFLARLRDSTVGGVDITGGLGVWGEYGDQKRFLLAAGGFNPRFRDVPAQLGGVLDRLGATFSVGRFNLALTGYFALTPATIQVGLNLRATAKIGSVGFEGDIGFDVLIYRRPRTHFIADFHVIAEVTYRGHTLAGVKVTGTIEGPGRWHVIGKATFSILWWDISTPFDESWGTAAPLLTDLVDVAALLGAALEVRENWSAQLPAGSEAVVTLAPRRGDQAPRAHPLGRFTFSQQVAPLGLTLEKFGDSGVSGPNHFDVESVTIGGRPIAEVAPGASSPPVREHFARAQFLEISEEDRLTRPAFEELDAGVQFSSSAFEVAAQPLRVSMAYETAYLDLDTRQTRAEPRAGVRDQALGYDLVQGFGRYGAAGRAAQRATEQMSAVRLPVAVSAPPVAAADRRTLDAVALDGPPTAAQMVVEQRIRRAGVAGAQVVEAFELVGA
jgi:hypothetical protein